MRKHFLRVLCLCLCLCLPAMADGVDYSMADKLFKQLDAGSGFAGTLTFTAEAVDGRTDGLTTAQPLTFDATYLYVREDAVRQIDAERRFTLSLKDGESAVTGAELSLRGGNAYLRADAAGDGWYALQAAAGTQAGGAAVQSAQKLLAQSALPGAMSFLLPLLLNLQNTSYADLDSTIDNYCTKLDLWIEGYRQNAVLGKLNDGTTTMEVHYDIPPAAVKAQLKQMVLDLLSDDALLTKLRGILPEGMAGELLDPAQQNYYFFAIDTLPLEQNMAISRKVSLKGDTLALHILLPFSDSEAGDVTLEYTRTAGEGDLPDENQIRLTSRTARLSVQYQKYSSLTGISVYQGTLLREPVSAGAFEVDSAAPAQTLSAAFSLSYQESNGATADGKEQLVYDVQFSVAPDYTPEDPSDETPEPTDAQRELYVTFPALECTLGAAFAGGQAKNASTALDLTLSVGGDTLPQRFTLALSGKTKSKWTPTAFNAAQAVSLDVMPQDELNQLLTSVGLKLGAALLPYVRMPSAAAASTEAPVETESPAVAPTETPAEAPAA